MQSPSNRTYEVTGEDITPPESVVPVFTAEGPSREERVALLAEEEYRQAQYEARDALRASAISKLVQRKPLTQAEAELIVGL